LAKHRKKGAEKYPKKKGSASAVVLIPCPEFHGDGFFVVKSHYLIEASADLKEAQSYTIFNDYGDRAIFWILNITKLQATKKQTIVLSSPLLR